MQTYNFILESNRIEGIYRKPSAAEIAEHERFIALDTLSVKELVAFVKVYQPDARLRDEPGLNVRVGDTYAPAGGAKLVKLLHSLIVDIGANRVGAWEAHVRYELLNPFTDCNGRSGRALWLWIVKRDGGYESRLGFLHAFYYQTLRSSTLALPERG